MVSESSCSMQAAPGRKKIPEQTDEAEDTVSDTNRAKEDPPQIKPTSQNAAESEEGDYPPHPNAGKSPYIRNCLRDAGRSRGGHRKVYRV